MYIFEDYVGNIPLAVYIFVAIIVLLIISQVFLLLIKASGRICLAVFLLEVCLALIAIFGVEFWHAGVMPFTRAGDDNSRTGTIDAEDDWIDYYLSLSKEEVLSEAVSISGTSDITYEKLMRNSNEYIGMLVELRCSIGTLIQMEGMDYYNYYIGSYNGWAEEPGGGFFYDNYVGYCLHDYRGQDEPYLLENDEVLIYGAFLGVSDYELVEGGNEKAPDIMVLYADFLA